MCVGARSVWLCMCSCSDHYIYVCIYIWFSTWSYVPHIFIHPRTYDTHSALSAWIIVLRIEIDDMFHPRIRCLNFTNALGKTWISFHKCFCEMYGFHFTNAFVKCMNFISQMLLWNVWISFHKCFCEMYEFHFTNALVKGMISPVPS